MNIQLRTPLESIADEFDSLSCKLILRESAQRLVVFFSGTDKSSGRFDFWKTGNDLDEHVLLVNNGVNAWYQEGIPGLGNLQESASNIKRLGEKLGCKEIITCGVSMGGYGAVLFAALLGCRCLAFGFDTILRYPLSRSYKRMPKRIKIVYKDLRSVVAGSLADVTAITGDMDFSDLLSLSRISDLENVKAMTLRGVAHGVARYIDKKYSITKVIKQYIESNSLPDFAEKGSACHEKKLSKLVFQAHQACTQENYDAALELSKRALKINPLSEPANFISGVINLQLRNYNQAAQRFAFTLGMLPHFLTAQFNLAKSLRLSNKLAEAEQHYLSYLAAMPDSAGARYSLALIYEGRSNSAALKLLNEAILIRPDNESYLKLRGKLLSN